MTENHNPPNSVFLSLDYRGLRDCVTTMLKQADRTRADVLLLTHQGETAVMKDYTGSNRGFSLILAPFLVHREVKALKKLEGINGIPELIKRSSARSFVMGYVNARSLKEVGADFDWQVFIDKTQGLIATLHERGVIHGDLRNATNILVDPAGGPVFVDLVSAVHRGRAWNPLGAMLFQLCLVLDFGGLYKLKKKFAPERIAESERHRFESSGPLEAVARACSALVRAGIRKIFKM